MITYVRQPLSTGNKSSIVLICRHMLKPGHWNLPLAGNVSIREAIHQWYESDNYSQQFDFRDGCDGPYCNEQCPETFKLGILGPTWPLALKVVIAAAVVIIGFTCVFLKCCFKIWLLWLENKQNKYLESLDNNLEEGSSHLAVSIMVICWLGMKHKIVCLTIHL